MIPQTEPAARAARCTAWWDMRLVLSRCARKRATEETLRAEWGRAGGTIFEPFFRNSCQSCHRRGYQLAELKSVFDFLAPPRELSGDHFSGTRGLLPSCAVIR